ncbi:hypothetical protein LCGC14_1715310 [marine sediment metagenome]|uniref:Dockerin domain-containing protein n=1 Tax=marine sediment metagenome TaxID=412755 RepID=A0A0F9I1K3_9ZZZZ
MVKTFTLILIACLAPIALGKGRLRVCEADGITPFNGREIMVGTRLTFIVSSDQSGYWSGGLFIAGQNRALGVLSARGEDPNTGDWAGSHYEETGDFARVSAWDDSAIWGFDLYTSDSNSTAGDWFILDYEAVAAGNPNVEFYDYDISWDDPNFSVSFSQVPSRDFNDDDSVNMLDYSILSSNWLVNDCNDPNWCDHTDIDTDGDVDVYDLISFADYWLWDVSYVRPPRSIPEEPNVIYCQEDPDIIYSIVNANGLSELIMNVGESITLYVDVETFGQDMAIFSIEVNISDSNLGWIDNTAYDVNNPPGPGTARILAQPRSSGFDYWGPGEMQQTGIQLFGANITNPISDGYLASFVYTCNAPGEITLELLNLDSSGPGGSLCPTLVNFTIDQVGSSQEMSMPGGMNQMSATPQMSTTSQTSSDDMVEWLESLWVKDGVSEMISEEEWDAFVESVKDSY